MSEPVSGLPGETTPAPSDARASTAPARPAAADHAGVPVPEKAALPAVQSIERLGLGTAFVPLIEKVLRGSVLLSQFTTEDLQCFAGFLQVYRAATGVPFIVEGDPGDFMVLVLEGHVEVFKKGPETERLLVGVAAPGKTLGEMSLVDGEPRFATCIAATRVTFAALPRSGLERIMKDHPYLGQKILLQLVLLLNQRLRDVSAELLQLWQKQA
jgi:CRP-like cAMP-binding protein